MMQPLRFRDKPNRQRARESDPCGSERLFRRFVIQYHRRLLLDGTLMVQVPLDDEHSAIYFPPQWSSRSIEEYRRP